MTTKAYFPQEVLEERFKLVELDLAAVMVDYMKLISEYPPDIQRAYLVGFSDALKEISWVLADRFDEIRSVRNTPVKNNKQSGDDEVW